MVVLAPCFTSSRAFSAASCNCKASASACFPLSAAPLSYAAAFFFVRLSGGPGAMGSKYTNEQLGRTVWDAKIQEVQ